MNARKTIWGSVGLLVGVVIAIVALTPEAWELPLLIIAFAVWGLWLLWTQALPFQRMMQAQRQKEQAESFNRAMAQTLLRHVNYRVSDCLKVSYPDARWEWMMNDPALFVAQGGTGRIRVYGVADYDFADVTVDQTGKLSCSLVSLSPVQKAAEKPVPPNQQGQDPQVWYNTHARQTLRHLVADLDSRGYSSMLLKEDGSICICPQGDSKETKQGALTDFPAKDRWNKLAEILEQEGLAATVRDTCIAVTW